MNSQPPTMLVVHVNNSNLIALNFCSQEFAPAQGLGQPEVMGLFSVTRLTHLLLPEAQ